MIYCALQPTQDYPEKETEMYKPIQPFVQFGESALENAARFASFALGQTERFTDFNLRSARATLTEGTDAAREVAGTTDSQKLAAARGRMTEAGSRQALAYTRGAYDLALDAQVALSAHADESFEAYAKSVTTFVEDATKQAPAGTEAATNALKASVAASIAAFSQISKAMRQLINVGDASVRAASPSAASFAKVKA